MSFLHVTLQTDLCFNLPSTIKIFLMVAELRPETKMKKDYGSGDIIRKQSKAELSFLYGTLHTDLFYDSTKYH